MPDTPLHFKTITEIAKLIESKQLSPVEVTRAMLERIDALDNKLMSYATLMAESAMAEARNAEQEIASGNYRGPLHGVPVAVKDLYYTKGVRTMGGSKVNADFVPDFVVSMDKYHRPSVLNTPPKRSGTMVSIMRKRRGRMNC